MAFSVLASEVYFIYRESEGTSTKLTDFEAKMWKLELVEELRADKARDVGDLQRQLYTRSGELEFAKQTLKVREAASEANDH